MNVQDECNTLKEKANNTSDKFFIAECAGLHISQLVSEAKRLKRQRDVNFFKVTVRTDNEHSSRVLKVSAKRFEYLFCCDVSPFSRRGTTRRWKILFCDLLNPGTVEHDADTVMFLCGEEYYLSKSVSEQVSEEYMFFLWLFEDTVAWQKGYTLSLFPYDAFKFFWLGAVLFSCFSIFLHMLFLHDQKLLSSCSVFQL